jgi:hypothetical protein
MRKVSVIDVPMDLGANPIFDVRNATAEMAGELILSALGKNIFQPRLRMTL